MERSALDFMGYGPPSPTAKPSTWCSKCGVDGEKVVSQVKFTWFEKVAGFFFGYRRVLSIIEEDPYCESYECPGCGYKWRTLKGG
ncbi:MAG: hypothetical protein ACYSW3_29775 [Planctomycetota bacterium]|jgi:hypothetical protein